METSKAYQRRLKDGFFEKFCNGNGLDIGAGADPLISSFGDVTRFDKEHGDANYLKGIADNSFDFVYSSHCLEHLDFPHIAIKNWFRVLKHGGYLILVLPHRDLYEKRRMLPSQWNEEHKSFWLPYQNDPPHTYSLRSFIHTYLDNYRIITFDGEEIVTRKDEWNELPPNVHSVGEYSIEAVIQKL